MKTFVLLFFSVMVLVVVGLALNNKKFFGGAKAKQEQYASLHEFFKDYFSCDDEKANEIEGKLAPFIAQMTNREFMQEFINGRKEALKISEGIDVSAWNPADDAVAIEGRTHLLVMENDKVRVLDQLLPPGTIQAYHTHKYPSIMIMLEPAKTNYNHVDPARSCQEDPDSEYVGILNLKPEGLHSVENIDNKNFYSMRIEFKQ